MSAIQNTLAKITERLGLNNALLARAQRRYTANRKHAYIAHHQQARFQRKADALRAAGNPRAAAIEDKRVARCSHRASKSHDRAQYFLGAIKRYQQTIHGLETTQGELQVQLRKLDHVTIQGNKASGGQPHERLKAVALASAAACASGHRTNFYSQSGEWDVTHCITGPATWHRDDCSSWVTSAYYSAELPDPNGGGFVSGGYTGTLLTHGHKISRDQLQPGDLVVYGSGTGHHTEMFVGPGEKTIGHGSAPVDAGIIDLFGPGEVMTFIRYV